MKKTKIPIVKCQQLKIIQKIIYGNNNPYVSNFLNNNKSNSKWTLSSNTYNNYIHFSNNANNNILPNNHKSSNNSHSVGKELKGRSRSHIGNKYSSNLHNLFFK